jgi:hypothetical protein
VGLRFSTRIGHCTQLAAESRQRRLSLATSLLVLNSFRSTISTVARCSLQKGKPKDDPYNSDKYCHRAIWNTDLVECADRGFIRQLMVDSDGWLIFPEECISLTSDGRMPPFSTSWGRTSIRSVRQAGRFPMRAPLRYSGAGGYSVWKVDCGMCWWKLDRKDSLRKVFGKKGKLVPSG